MTDIQKRITTFENDCLNNHAEQYEGCLDCAKELKAIITELTEQNKKLVDALEFYANPNNYELYYDDDDADMNGAMNGKAKAVLQELNTE